MLSRRAFLKQNSLLAAGARAAWAAPFMVTAARSAPVAPIAEATNEQTPRPHRRRHSRVSRRTIRGGYFR